LNLEVYDPRYAHPLGLIGRWDYRGSIHHCLTQLQNLASEKNGLDYLQVFDDPDRPEPLWFMDDGPGGAITALLPSDH
jgi:hypothetical protein